MFLERALSWRAAAPAPAPEADVCLIVEGCYPYIAGGVSTWIDWLIRGHPHLTFSVVAIVAGAEPRQSRYRFPPNLVHVADLQLHTHVGARRWWDRGRETQDAGPLANALTGLLLGGGLREFSEAVGIVNDPKAGLALSDLLASRLSWDVVSRMYGTIMPHASFLHFFWAWRALFGGLFATLKAPVPPARIYHTISTGYAGLLAARTALETGRPALITEHGIYTNERRIEILMAEWIHDTVDKGLSLRDDRIDLRDIWIHAFEAYARVCYQACSRITTLYEDNQRLQLALGAERELLAVIPNGIEIGKFENLPLAPAGDPPTMALIGRVVPIKDVKTFIAAVAGVKTELPALRALIMGPTSEDEGYHAECATLIRELGLEDTVVFTGPVNLVEHLPKVHVVVLTSLSEAQPLVLLEAGAAGIPCVATDVGSCREIVEGRSDETPKLGPGGIVTELVNPRQTAHAVCRLLGDPETLRRYGEAMRARVRRYYSSSDALHAYGALYEHHFRHGGQTLQREA